MITRRSAHLVLALLMIGWASGSLASETVYLTRQEALSLFFADAEKVEIEKKPVGGSTAVFYVGRRGREVTGYAYIDNKTGKTRPITYLVGLTPMGKVARVEVLIYRETHGSEVRSPRFTRQFIGKGSRDPISLGKDIANISGATLSSRAIADGVKGVVALWEKVYGAESRQTTPAR